MILLAFFQKTYLKKIGPNVCNAATNAKKSGDIKN